MMGFQIGAEDTYFNKYTLECARMAVGGTINSVDAIFKDKIC